jgi:pyrroloquinoline quinone (PQQ) biosynthesis protein C
MDASGSFCVQLGPQWLLMAMGEGRCWLVRLDTSKTLPLPASSLAIQCRSLIASAIEGAIATGLSQTCDSPAADACTMGRYIRWLVGNYIFAAQTPGLFRRAASRFEASCRSDLAAFALKKAEEEDGHANLAYRDLEALGLPVDQVTSLIRPPSADSFVDRFRAYVESTRPIMLFGFSYCLERMALARSDLFIRKIQAICPPKAHAIRFLTVHSGAGSDSSHVHEQLSFFESLNNGEQSAVVLAAFETAAMLARQHLMDQSLTDEEIFRRLRRSGIRSPHYENERKTDEICGDAAKASSPLESYEWTIAGPQT